MWHENTEPWTVKLGLLSASDARKRKPIEADDALHKIALQKAEQEAHKLLGFHLLGLSTFTSPSGKEEQGLFTACYLLCMLSIKGRGNKWEHEVT